MQAIKKVVIAQQLKQAATADRDDEIKQMQEQYKKKLKNIVGE